MRFAILIFAVVILMNRYASACLRPQIDERAVQWSKLIIEGKLVEVSPRVELTSFEIAQGNERLPKIKVSYWYRLYTIEVTAVLDGSAKVGEKIQMVRFFGQSVNPMIRCAQKLTQEQIGKEFLLLLTPQRDLEMQAATGAGGKTGDVRTEDLRQHDAWATVYAELKTEVDADALTSLKKTISEVRGREGSFKPDEAKRQAHALAESADDTEADDAEKSLREMGAMAAGSIREVLNKNEVAGKSRLQELLKDLSPPPLPVAMEMSRPIARKDDQVKE